MQIKVLQHITMMRHELSDAHHQLKVLALMDQLTGLYNRAQFETSVKEKIAEANRYKQNIAIIFVDFLSNSH